VVAGLGCGGLGMGELINRLSSYNLFNYLFPGAVFIVLLNEVTSYNLIQESLFAGALLYYFVGMVISRIGSLVVEPFLKLIHVVKFAEYSNFVAAQKTDEKLEVLSEANNTYRTLISTFLLLLCAMLFDFSESKCDWLNENKLWVSLVVLLLLFVGAYRKQTAYITKRVEKTTAKK
jgi:hypothetical protein